LMVRRFRLVAATATLSTSFSHANLLYCCWTTDQ
jgi:hypothetical protein